MLCKPDIEYVGHIVSPIGNYVAIVLMHKDHVVGKVKSIIILSFLG